MGLGVGERARCRHASTVADMLQQLPTCFNNSGGASHRDSGAAQPVAPAYTAAHTPPPLQTPQAPGSRCTWPPLEVLPGAALVQLEAALVRLDPELQPRPACAHVRMCVSGRVGAQGACACGRVCWRRCPLLASHGVCWCLLRDACTLTHRHKDTGAIQVRYNRLARSVHIDKQVGTQRQSGWHS